MQVDKTYIEIRNLLILIGYKRLWEESWSNFIEWVNPNYK